MASKDEHNQQKTGYFSFVTGGALQGRAFRSFQQWQKAESAPLPPGYKVGPYEIRELIGEGGFSQVYRAWRDLGGYGQEVALKLLCVTTDQDYGNLEQLQHEGAVLARLQHPGIARLIDAGFTEDARPFFVLEYIEGQDILSFAADNSLTLKARIQLVIDLLEALQHAHNLLVIHRDIKPGNILIDQNGKPRILDFGIASLLDTLEEESSDQGQRLFTPRFASPEQIQGEPVVVASDIYQVGVVLYMLLMHQHPFDDAKKSAYSNQFREFLADTQDATQNHPVASEKAPAGRFKNKIKGDLEAIIKRALSWNAADRYVTAEQFSRDLQSFLEDRPVSARRRTFMYVASKFIKANRWPVGVVTAAVLVIGSVVGFYSWRLHGELRRVEELKNFTLSMFSDLDPARRIESLNDVAQMLEHSYLGLNRYIADSRSQGELLTALAQVYQRAGDLERSETLIREALDLLNQTPGDNLSKAMAYTVLGEVLRRSGKSEAALRVLEQGYAMAAHIPDEKAPYFLVTNVLQTATAYGDLLQAETARPYFERAYALADKAPLSDVERSLIKLHYAESLFRNMAPSRLLQILDDACQVFENVEDKNLAIYSRCMRARGVSYREQALYRQALDVLIPFHEQEIQYLGADSGQSLSTTSRIAVLHHLAGAFSESIATYDQAVMLAQQRFGENSADAAYYRVLQSYPMFALGYRAAALEQVVKAKKLIENSELKGRYFLYTEMIEAWQAALDGQYDRAIALADHSGPLLIERFGEEGLDTSIAMRYAWIYVQSGVVSQAGDYLDRALKRYDPDRHAPRYAYWLGLIRAKYENLLGNKSGVVRLCEDTVELAKASATTNPVAYVETLLDCSSLMLSNLEYRKATQFLSQLRETALPAIEPSAYHALAEGAWIYTQVVARGNSPSVRDCQRFKELSEQRNLGSDPYWAMAYQYCTAL